MNDKVLEWVRSAFLTPVQGGDFVMKATPDLEAKITLLRSLFDIDQQAGRDAATQLLAGVSLQPPAVTPAAASAIDEKKGDSKPERVPLTAEQKTMRSPEKMKKLQGKKDEHKKGYDKIMNKHLDALDGGSSMKFAAFKASPAYTNLLTELSAYLEWEEQQVVDAVSNRHRNASLKRKRIAAAKSAKETAPKKLKKSKNPAAAAGGERDNSSGAVNLATSSSTNMTPTRAGVQDAALVTTTSLPFPVRSVTGDDDVAGMMEALVSAAAASSSAVDVSPKP